MQSHPAANVVSGFRDGLWDMCCCNAGGAVQMIKLMAKKPHEKKSQIQAVMRELTSKKMMEHVREWMEPPDGDRLTSVRDVGLLQRRLSLPAVAHLQPRA